MTISTPAMCIFIRTRLLGYLLIWWSWACAASALTPCTRLQYFLKANELNLIDAMNHEELSVTVHRVLRAYHTTFGGGMTIPTLGIKGIVKLEAGIR